MEKEKLKEVAGFAGFVGLLGLYVIGFLIFLCYKLFYAPHYDLSPILIERFTDKVMLCQSVVLWLAFLSLLRDLAGGKKIYSQILIYIFAFIFIYGITGGIMGIVDLLSGKPYSIL